MKISFTTIKNYITKLKSGAEYDRNIMAFPEPISTPDLFIGMKTPLGDVGESNYIFKQPNYPKEKYYEYRYDDIEGNKIIVKVEYDELYKDKQ